jgi:hypothetical protein
LADPDPNHNLKTLKPDEQVEPCGMYNSVDGVARYTKFPIYVHLCSSSLKTRKYDELGMIDAISVSRDKWLRSAACAALTTTVLKLKNTARITNIVYIGLGSLTRSLRSIMQHLVAGYMAELLTALYITAENDTEAGAGAGATQRVTIISQDPAYSDSDEILLECQPHPIRVVSDPEALLAINSSSFDTMLPDVDQFTVPMRLSGAEHYFVDAKARRVLDLLDGYKQVMHVREHPMG